MTKTPDFVNLKCNVRLLNWSMLSSLADAYLYKVNVVCHDFSIGLDNF